MNTHTENLKLRQLLPIILNIAGEDSGILKRCVLFDCLTAVLRGFVFVGFIPLSYGIAAHNLRDVITVAAIMTLLAVLASICNWFGFDYDYNGHAGRSTDRLRRSLGQHLRKIPLQRLYEKRSGELSAAIAGDVDDVINYTMMIILMLCQAVITPIAVGLGALYYDWRLGLALLIIFPAIIPIYLTIRPMLSRHRQEQHALYSELSAETIEYTQGLPILKAANCINDKHGRLNTLFEKRESIQAEAMRREAPANLLLASSVEIGMLLIVGLGLWLVSAGDIPLMLIAALMVATIRFAEPLSTFIGMMNIVEMIISGYSNLKVLQDIEPLPQKQPVQVPQQYNIDYHNVDFTYSGQTEVALSHINLHIPAHALTALVGPSGCGKTTLIRMLMRFADPQQGEITIGGIDIRNIEPETLNQLIAVVFQDVYLFDDTILANIRMGKADASDEAVIQAAKAAQCHEFIEKLPDGYHTRVGDIGNNLSGGEKQRISIARALLKDAPIIILDEPTAALDTYSELAVQRAIDVLIQQKTVIVIAHRLSTIVAAKQIVVLDNGSISEIGDHQTLLAQHGRYAKLWHAQQYRTA